MLIFQAGDRLIRYRERLKITETFHSLQGEGKHSGLPCTFIRLTGCALRCSYCDTAYAFHGGEWRDFGTLFDYIAAQTTRLVQITGGEPLHQKAVWPFIAELVRRGYQPLIETSGAEDIAGLDSAAHIVLDIKTPGSGEVSRNRWENLAILKASDEIKFVITSMDDLNWSIDQIRSKALDQRFQLLISPVANSPQRALFADTLLAAGVHARFQIQLHKILWGEIAGK